MDSICYVSEDIFGCIITNNFRFFTQNWKGQKIRYNIIDYKNLVKNQNFFCQTNVFTKEVTKELISRKFFDWKFELRNLVSLIFSKNFVKSPLYLSFMLNSFDGNFFVIKPRILAKFVKSNQFHDSWMINWFHEISLQRKKVLSQNLKHDFSQHWFDGISSHGSDFLFLPRTI